MFAQEAADNSEADIRHQLGFGDEPLNKAEAHEKLEEHFNQIDTDQDGRLSFTELHTRFSDHMGKRWKRKEENFASFTQDHFERTDKDKSGKLSLEEYKIRRAGFPDMVEYHFRFWDKNGDGELDLKEYQDEARPFSSGRWEEYALYMAEHEIKGISGAKEVSW